MFFVRTYVWTDDREMGKKWWWTSYTLGDTEVTEVRDDGKKLIHENKKLFFCQFSFIFLCGCGRRKNERLKFERIKSEA